MKASTIQPCPALAERMKNTPNLPQLWEALDNTGREFINAWLLLPEEEQDNALQDWRKFMKLNPEERAYVLELVDDA